MATLDHSRFWIEKGREKRVGVKTINLLRQNLGFGPLPGTRHSMIEDEFTEFVAGNSTLAIILREHTFYPGKKS
jgi:hypothetical protein